MFLCLAQVMAVTVAFVVCLGVPTAQSLREQQHDYCSSSSVRSLDIV